MHRPARRSATDTSSALESRRPASRYLAPLQSPVPVQAPSSLAMRGLAQLGALMGKERERGRETERWREKKREAEFERFTDGKETGSKRRGTEKLESYRRREENRHR